MITRKQRIRRQPPHGKKFRVKITVGSRKREIDRHSVIFVISFHFIDATYIPETEMCCQEDYCVCSYLQKLPIILFIRMIIDGIRCFFNNESSVYTSRCTRTTS